jgi:hypothetical protein
MNSMLVHYLQQINPYFSASTFVLMTKMTSPTKGTAHAQH